MIALVYKSSWPNTFDVVITAAFLAVVLLVPLAGYVFMAMDLRTYVRSLRRGLAVIGRYLPDIPDWARHHTPRAVAALGLRMPCTEDDLKRAYRQRVKLLHPDHGGDQRRFLILQANFEEALSLIQPAAPLEQTHWAPREHAV